MAVRLNIDRLIEDLGGARAVAASIDCQRTAPYRWKKQNRVSSDVLSRIKAAHPDLNLNAYFEPVQ